MASKESIDNGYTPPSGTVVSREDDLGDHLVLEDGRTTAVEMEVVVADVVHGDKDPIASRYHREAATSSSSIVRGEQEDDSGILFPPPSSGSSSVMGSRQLPFWKRFLIHFDPPFMIAVRWSISILLIAFSVAVIFGIFYSGITYEKKVPPTCETPFGTILGVADGVFGYSNCNDHYYSTNGSFIELPSAPGNGMPLVTLYAGLQWQCVEYGRRYWMLQGSSTSAPAAFGDVDGAADIWNLAHVTLLRNASETLPLRRYRNGQPVVQGGVVPAYKDLLLYERREPSFPHGHVAVVVQVVLFSQLIPATASSPSSSSASSTNTPFIGGDIQGRLTASHLRFPTRGTGHPHEREEHDPPQPEEPSISPSSNNSGVDRNGDYSVSTSTTTTATTTTRMKMGYIRVAEQNWQSIPWVGQNHNYTREIPIIYDSTTAGFIVDDPDGPVLGWVRY